jgi:hypothetical protein|tara:strand:- start:1228 stop:1551 length:324 start_codon:yes stop_codon:yes gene_type:complete
MATGILGTPADMSATTNTTIYTVPADNFAIVSINITNRATSTRDIRIALAASDTPTNAEWIEYDTEIVANGTLERSGIVIDATKKVVAYANSTDVTVMVYGIETSTT